MADMVSTCQHMVHALDPALDEYIYSGAFWTLGVFIIVNGIWVTEQFDQYMEIDRQSKFAGNQSPAAAALHAKRTPARYFWLQPHITTRTRQFLSVVASAFVVPVQLLELSWIFRAAWHLSAAVAAKTCATTERSEQPFLYSCAVCLPTLAVVLVSWATLLKASLGWVFTQLSFVLQLNSLQSENPLELRGVTLPPAVEFQASDEKR